MTTLATLQMIAFKLYGYGAKKTMFRRWDFKKYSREEGRVFLMDQISIKTPNPKRRLFLKTDQ
jgi:hypothetical protein